MAHQNDKNSITIPRGTAPKRKSLIKKIARKYNLELILLFGSQVRYKKYLHQESDFDVAYLSSRDLDLTEEAQLIVDLAPVFKSENIDLTNLKNVNPLLRYEISRNCVSLYGTEENLFNLKALAFKDYINHLPLLDLEDFLIKKRQKLFAQSLYGQ